jgi:cation transporter-like permease
VRDQRSPHLERIRKLKRREYHPLLHEAHKKHGISRKTLFYVKEYGPHSNAARTIIRESVKILVLASVISSLGGLALEQLKMAFIAVTPLVILLPVLNDAIGDFGTIVSSRYSTMLHEGKAHGNWLENPELQKLFAQIIVVAVLAAGFSAGAALILSGFYGYSASLETAAEVFLIALVDMAVLVCLVFAIAVIAGRHFYNEGEDPNNFLIPITTAVADFANMAILAVLVTAFF